MVGAEAGGDACASRSEAESGVARGTGARDVCDDAAPRDATQTLPDSALREKVVPLLARGKAGCCVAI